MGFNSGVKSFRLWCPKLYKIIVSRDVTFDESDVKLKEDIQIVELEEQVVVNSQPKVVNSEKESKWHDAMDDEMFSLHKNKTWELVELLKGRKTIACKWVYAKKDGVDDKSLHSSIRILLALVAQFNLELVQLDVKIAFFHEKLKERMRREFEMKDLGEAKKILGMEITKDRQKGTPLGVHFKLSSQQCPKTDKEKMKMDGIPYVNLVGGLMYAMVCTRSDIAHAAGIVNRFMHNPGREHWNAAKWILRQETIDDWVCVYYGKRSCMLEIILQPKVILSTIEAEYMAIAEVIKEAMWTLGLLGDLGVEQHKLDVYCDSQNAIHFAKYQEQKRTEIIKMQIRIETAELSYSQSSVKKPYVERLQTTLLSRSGHRKKNIFDLPYDCFALLPKYLCLDSRCNNKKKVNDSDNMSLVNEKQSKQITEIPPEECKMPLVWIDLEMTGEGNIAQVYMKSFEEKHNKEEYYYNDVVM
ncbi:hypothetical protein D8674_034363 [Pyrus ussuriensis x Pyrus communis]|uniref:Retroviral polymerase SH3-like domain-containing protein n=1 Tax=Pyrus ussuriensis x Pyrus communis TaxID=2448454 RepID=A0A5N5HPQ7_9ROSA|nr:hypothetical protein D8674_034363 [Pyrus ussuriensis x Pyrus communis]